ncbi:MAG: lipoyl synthase [Candidatus Micrarchaeaceae archaeon]
MLPEWLSIKPASTEKYSVIKETIAKRGLHTVCSDAHCPNASECWSSGTATFMVLGGLCTRGCRFCAVKKSATGEKPNLNEPFLLAKSIKEWGLDYVVITSVCRDDLPDQGASHFANCVVEIKKQNPNTFVELLIPDFSGDISLLKVITDSKPDVIGNNLETVRNLSKKIRDKRADYDQTLSLLKNIKKLNNKIFTKSAIMLGMGETSNEILETMEDLRNNKVDFLAMGQYLRPSQFHTEVKEYVTPEKFSYFKKIAEEKGFLFVASGPFVRSSYKAGEFFIKSLKNTNYL